MIRGARFVYGFIAVLLLQLTWLPAPAAAGIISTKQEVAIGRDVAESIEKQYEVLDDPELQERVDRIGRSLVAVCRRPDLPYSFKVLNVDEVNAMAAPGGFIYVFRGLIDLMPTDDELAGIIGHEIGHVVKRHSMSQLEKSLGMTILMGGIFGDRGVMLQAVALNAIVAGYSRSDEREADKMGYELSVAAGYNQYGMLMGLTKLYELNPTHKSDLFSDHPETGARMKLVNRYLDENKVTVKVKALDDGNAQVVRGDWSLPPITVPVGNTRQLYRAYLVAGRVFAALNTPDYNPNYYVLDSDGTNLQIYYDDQLIITLSPEDAWAAGLALDELAAEYLSSLRKLAASN